MASGGPRARSASRRLIERGVVNDTPISHAVELGAERIYILPMQAPQKRPTRIPAAALDAAIQGRPSARGLTA
jgi:hypothetical protein